MGDEAPKTRRSKRDYSSHFDWSQEMNFDVYKCYLKAREDPSLGYMVRLKTYWDKLHPELTVFNAKQLRQQATFVETKMDINIEGKSPHLKLDAIIAELKMDAYDKNGGKRNGYGEPLSELQFQKNAENVFGKKLQERFEVNNNGCHVNGDGKPVPPNTRNSRKGGKHYYEPVMTTGAPVKHLYREAMEQVHTYNSKLLLERRLRMPYIDNQTGLAQQDCHLWVSRVQRCAPIKEGQIYSYPSRRWMVRKRPDFVGASKNDKKTAADGEDVGDGVQDEKTAALKADDNSMDGSVHTPVTTYEDYYDEDAFDSELDSDEEFGSRKKKKKTGRGSGRGNKKSSMALKFGERIGGGGRAQSAEMTRLDNKTKVYECQICNKRYKNSQSLRYHYEHYNHHNNTDNQQNNNVQNNSTTPGAPTSNTEATTTPTVPDQPPPDHVTGAKRKKGMPPSSYCDFCLGSSEMNKKSGTAEEMISCADCGRSGHPTCLQFNGNLTGQCKKYKWQCIECKCCCLCGTSDNDDQLLFCDDCDRGYHMYCLNPPIDEPPEGSWQCQLCEARVKGEDITKVSVLPQHMDFGKGPAAPTPTTINDPAGVSAENGNAHALSSASSSFDPSLSSTMTNTSASQSNGHGPIGGLQPGHPNVHPFAQRSMHGGPPRGGSHPQMHMYGSQHPPPYHPQYGSQYGPQYPPQYGSPYGAPPPYGYPGSHHGPPNSQHRGMDPSQRPPQYGSPHGGPQYPPHGMRHPLHPMTQHPSQRGPPHLGGPRSHQHGGPNPPTSHMQHRAAFGVPPYPNNMPPHPDSAKNGTPPAQQNVPQHSAESSDSKQPSTSSITTTSESQPQQQPQQPQQPQNETTPSQPQLSPPTASTTSETPDNTSTDTVPTTKPTDGPTSGKESDSSPPPVSSV